MRTFLYLLALSLILSSACGTEPPSRKPSCCVKSPGADTTNGNTLELSDKSLYQTESRWTNDVNHSITLKDLGGKLQIVTMFFANCQYACPLLVYDMQRIEKALPAELRSQVQFTLVTFDTEYDTTEALHTYRQAHHLGDNWTLLRGNSDDVLELAALLGVKFKKDERGQFAHSNVITLLDRKGEIVSQQIGLNRDPSSTVAAVRKLLERSAD